MDVLFDTLKWLTHNILNSNTRLKYSMGIVSITLLALLAACGPTQATPPVNITEVHNTAIAAVRTDFALSQAPHPTPTGTLLYKPFSPPPTPPPTLSPSAASSLPPSRTPLPTQTLLPYFPLEGLRLAYIIEGNLYVQDSGGKPTQLTDSGEDHTPIFSDDGEKIVFFRGDLPRDVYSINADGSQEQVLITSSLLTNLGLGYSEFTEPRFLTFIPGTHVLLFQTHELDPQIIQTKDINRLGAKLNQDLLLVDTDTAKIQRLKASGQASFYNMSPNGQLVWILAEDHIDVIGLNGKAVYSNLTTYPPASPEITMPDMYWAQDSSMLSLVLPPSKTALGYNGPEERTIWQYPLDGSPADEIHLMPPPVGSFYDISPNGNWVAYIYSYYPGIPEEAKTSGIYIGNLRDGSSKLVESEEVIWFPNSFAWSPDNRHFIFWDNRSHLFLSNINGEVSQIAVGSFLGWIDSNRFVFINGGVAMGKIGKEANVRVADLPTGIKYFNQTYFTFVFPTSKAEQ